MPEPEIPDRGIDPRSEPPMNRPQVSNQSRRTRARQTGLLLETLGTGEGPTDLLMGPITGLLLLKEAGGAGSRLTRKETRPSVSAAMPRKELAEGAGIAAHAAPGVQSFTVHHRGGEGAVQCFGVGLAPAPGLQGESGGPALGGNSFGDFFADPFGQPRQEAPSSTAGIGGSASANAATAPGGGGG